MPRTKVPSVGSDKTTNIEQKIDGLMREWESQFQLVLTETREQHNVIRGKIEEHVRLDKHNYPSSMGNKTIRELRNAETTKRMLKGAENSTFFDGASIYLMSSTQKSSINMSHLNASNCTKKSAMKKTNYNKNSDEGYLTAESQRALSNDRIRGRSPVRHSYKPRNSRSLSRSKLPKNVTIQAPASPVRGNTPDKRMPPPCSYGFVTPKVKPNTPLTVLRRPKQGEMAISMQGSPLLVNGIITEACANVNIPLEDGRVLSLQPSKNIRMSQLPAIPDDTRLQLAKLRDHLNKVCEFTK